MTTQSKSSQLVEQASGSAGGSEERDSTTSEPRRKELADFFRTRREKIKPEDVGLTQGARRRTPGLRREEVAELAGVGTTWYTWLEQARDIQPSSVVLRRLAQALKLTDAEIRHMFMLAGKAPPADTEADNEHLTPALERFLNEALLVPAVVLGRRWDIIGYNVHAAEKFPGLAEIPENRRNWLHYVFCLNRNSPIIKDWETNARRILAEFRASIGELIDNPWVIEIIDSLKKESPEFARWWLEHDVCGPAPVTVAISADAGPELANTMWERVVLCPCDNPRFRILVLTPLKPK